MGKQDLNMHVLTALSCGPCGSWSTCSCQAGSATGVQEGCAGGDKAAFVPPACSLRSRMTWGLVRCSVQCKLQPSVYSQCEALCTVTLCEPWEWGTAKGHCSLLRCALSWVSVPALLPAGSNASEPVPSTHTQARRAPLQGPVPAASKAHLCPHCRGLPAATDSVIELSSSSQ